MSAKSLPFVAGVLAELSGQPVHPLPRFKDRRFVTINRETLPRFFRFVRPTVQVECPGAASPVVISFDSLEQLSIGGAMRKAADETEAQAIAARLQNDRSFQELCGSWKALEFLVSAAAQFPNVSIKVLNTSKKEVFKDVQRATEFDQSALFKFVYGELDTFGGEPFSCLVADFGFTAHPNDTELLEKMSQVAAVAATSLFTNAVPELFRLTGWPDLNPALDMHWWHADSSFAKWNEFMHSDDAASVFLFAGRWTTSGGMTWLNPAYLAAAAVLGVFGDSDLTAATERLAEGQEGSAVALSREVNFESTPNQGAAEQLRVAGLNFVSDESTKASWLLHVRPASTRAAACSLAHRILVNSLHRRAKAVVRDRVTSSSFEAFERVVQEWIAQEELTSSPGHRLAVEFMAPPRPDQIRLGFEFRAAWNEKRQREFASFSIGSVHVSGPALAESEAARQLRCLILTDRGGAGRKDATCPLFREGSVKSIHSLQDLAPEDRRTSRFAVASGTDDGSFELQVDASDVVRLRDHRAAASYLVPFRKTLDERELYAKSAHYLNISAARSVLLDRMVRRPGAFSALVRKLDALEALATAGSEAPLDLETIVRSLPGSDASVWKGVLELREAVWALDNITQGRTASNERTGVQRVADVLSELDESISMHLIDLYDNPEFKAFESQYLPFVPLLRLADAGMVRAQYTPMKWSSIDRLNEDHGVAVLKFHERLSVAVNDDLRGTFPEVLLATELPRQESLLPFVRLMLQSVNARGGRVLALSFEGPVDVGDIREWLWPLFDGPGGERLLLVEALTDIGRKYAPADAHPASFAFGRGRTDPELSNRVTSIYQVAAAVMQIADKKSEQDWLISDLQFEMVARGFGLERLGRGFAVNRAPELNVEEQ